MITVAHSLRFAACFTAVFILMPWGNASSGATKAQASAPAGHPGMLRELQAAGPHPSLGNGAELLDRLTGSWDIDYSFHSKDGQVSHGSGEFLAGWVMDGRAVQAVWTVDPRRGRKDREIYTSLHYLDPKSGTLYLTFIDPENASPEHQPVARFTGAAQGDKRAVFLTQDLSSKGGRSNRWSFDYMSPGSLTFRDEQSSDGGKTWRLLEEDRFTRRDGSPAAAVMQNLPHTRTGAI